VEEFQPTNKSKAEELPDSWWYRVYAAVMIITTLVILALWGFTSYFT
jgi:hypothetical protein